MLSVIQAKYIKELREVKGLSVAKISSMNEIAWKTAKKYADEDVVLENRPLSTAKTIQHAKNDPETSVSGLFVLEARGELRCQ